MASQDHNMNDPDLASVLRTLSSFSNQADHNHHNHLTTTTADQNDNDSYEPSDALPPLTYTKPPKPTASFSSPSSSPFTPPPSQGPTRSPRPTNPKPSSFEVSSITTWPAALKQVMRTVAPNEEIQRRIRFLTQRQHDHERQWWQGREALARKQRSRAEKKKELDQVLRSVGAPIDSKEISTAEEDLAELRNYDAKVYKASRQMADAMVAELKALNIPFFCLKSGLVSDSDSKAKESGLHLSNTSARESDKQQQLYLSRSELSALQRRMLDLLQDLCKD